MDRYEAETGGQENSRQGAGRNDARDHGFGNKDLDEPADGCAQQY